MANLLGQNIGTNYKGILNLNTLNGNLSGTLQAVTDGDGNASPLQLSTSQVAVSGNSATNASTTAYFIYDASVNPNARNYAIGTSALAYGDLNFMRSNTLGGEPLSGTSVGKFDLNGNFSIGIGTTAASARLQVRGDGTNPIARFESNDGSINWRFSAGGFGLENSYQAGIFGAAISGDYSFAAGSYNNLTGTGAFQGIANISGTIAVPSSGTGNKHILAVNYTINNAGAQTGTATGIFLNATETALNGMTHNLLDLQVGGNPKFTISRTGLGYFGSGVLAAYFSTNAFYYFSSRGALSAPSDGVFTLLNNAENGFSRLQFGGTTNAFPAIKRNGAAIDFRLADDSAACNISAMDITAVNSLITTQIFSGGAGTTRFGNNVLMGQITSGSITASATVEIRSTTLGFLPPRMTTTQRDLIATPAAGLMIYNTTTNRPNFYDGSAWVAL
jgi:hypothetical protein